MEILLVEDNPGDVRLVAEALTGTASHEHLHVARDGADALAFLRRSEGYPAAPFPHLILLDLKLPRKDGFAVLAEVKRDPDLKRIPVVILTSSSAEPDVARAYDLHANCYVVKPARLDDFTGTIRAIEQFWSTTVRHPTR
jgi:CheY-like chemotaxis protein